MKLSLSIIHKVATLINANNDLDIAEAVKIIIEQENNLLKN